MDMTGINKGAKNAKARHLLLRAAPSCTHVRSPCGRARTPDSLATVEATCSTSGQLSSFTGGRRGVKKKRANVGERQRRGRDVVRA